MSFISFLRSNLPFLTAGMLLTFSSSYGQTFFISLFAAELKADFGLTDGGWGAIYTAGTVLSAIVMVWAGALTDQYRVRGLIWFVAPGLAAACIFMALAPAAGWLVLVIFGLRFFGQGMMHHLAVVAMARWFVGNRGKALSVASIGFNLGQAFLPMIFVALLALVAWQWLWVLAAAMALAALPFLHRLLTAERTPQSVAKDQAVAGMDGKHWTRGDVLRHPLFWFLVPMLLGPPAWGTALFFHQVHLVETKGWDLLDYVALMPLYTVVAVAATFAIGALIDRFGTAILLILYLIPFAAGFALMGGTSSLIVAALAFVVFGIGAGAQATIPTAFWAEFYGTQYLGSLKALTSAIMVLGSAVGPGISGLFIDWGWAFEDQMLWYVVYFVAAIGCVALGVIPAQRRLPPAA